MTDSYRNTPRSIDRGVFFWLCTSWKIEVGGGVSGTGYAQSSCIGPYVGYTLTFYPATWGCWMIQRR